MGSKPSEPEAPSAARVGEDQSDPQLAYNNLAELYELCGAPVFRLALRVSGSRQDAEDLTHDVFLRYWQQRRYEPCRGPVLAYLLMMTRSMALNRIQQRRNRWDLVQRWKTVLTPSAVPSPHENASADELAERVRNALDAIPTNQRQVLEMAYYEGLSQSAISERLQLPLGTVKTRSRQGLIRLRELLIDFRNAP